MSKAMCLDIDLVDCDVFFDVLVAPTQDDSAEVKITRIEKGGVDITGILSRKELDSVRLGVESSLEDEWATSVVAVKRESAVT